jgi:outer membrane protein OmpA-like peptidoglycan-associated protein
MKRIVALLFLVSFLAIWVQPDANAQKPKKIISQADKAYEKKDLKSALDLYKQAIGLQPDNIHVNHRLGQIYLEQKEPGVAVPFLEKAVKLTLKFNPEYVGLLAKAYHLSLNFDAAREQYQLLAKKTNRKEEMIISDLNKRIKECDSGKDLMANPPVADIRNLGAGFNSPADDYGPLLTAGDKILFFTSRRKTPSNQSSEDIYEVQRGTGGWGSAQALAKPVNSSEHEGVTGVSPDGNTLYMYRNNNNGDIFETTRTGTVWSKPKALPEPVNSPEYESSYFVVKDGQFAFFASDREGGFGGLDLYLVMKQANGTWSEALNLGVNVNSEYDEDGPSVDARGILYFSSRGHNSMGGFDIFSSTSTGAAWSQARNAGYPVNTPYDDLNFTATISGRQGIFSSDRSGTTGGKDLFEATFRRETASDSLAASQAPEARKVVGAPVKPEIPQVLLKGIALDSGSGVPLYTRIMYHEMGTAEAPTTFMADSLSGKFVILLDKGKPYTVEVHKKGYFYDSEQLNVPEAYLPDSLAKEVRLKKMVTGSKFILKQVFFESGNTALTPGTRLELDRVYHLLTENPSLKAEISGHTDDQGKPLANQVLSLSRAKAVVAYLVSKGIAADRLTAKGYGSEQPVASNRFEDGRKQNRRTEFKVISE